MGFFSWRKKKKEKNIEPETVVAENNIAEEISESEESVVEEQKEDDAEIAETSDDKSAETEEEIENVEETESTEETENVEETEPTEEETENVEESEPTEESENIEEPEITEVVEEEPKPEKKGFFAKIKAGLTKTRNNIMGSVDNVLKAFVKIDEELFEELEEALIMADIGVETSVYIIEKLREKVKDERITDASQVKDALVQVINNILVKDDTPLELPSPSVILVIGVNGVGKTTTIGKLTHSFKQQGKSVLLAAADTFRAAAIDQLEVWADRNNVGIIKHQENSDPGAVVFDAAQAAKARKTDILICDTAGRLHNKKNLMEELRKISRIVAKEYPQAHMETFLVLDATTGQNAIQQAKLFKEVADITGIVLTKLDGTAKGGIVLAIKNEMNIPVRFIGVGEGLDDLQPFDSAEFAKALFDNE